MYLKKIELHNIRGFESLVFDLTRPDGSYAGWTVFTGDNGAGKSSLLKAIAVGLTGKETARALQPNFQRWVRDGTTQGSIRLTIVPERGVDEFSVGGRTAFKPFPATVNLDAKDRDTRLEMEESQKDVAASTNERAKLRAELDGLVAHLYGLTEEEFIHILGTFPLVGSAVKVDAHNAYRRVAGGLIQ